MSVDNVADIEPIDQYVALAAQTEFDYTFPIFEDGDLVVYVNDTEQTYTTDYTVSGAGDDNGGTVTFVSGLTAGDIVTIYRDIPIERLTDISQNGPRRSADMNDELDRMTMLLQQLERNIGRCVRLSLRNAQASSALELSPIATWADRYLYINEDGELEPAANLTTTTLTQSIIGGLLNPQTDAEDAANVTPTDLAFPTDEVDRHSPAGDGSTDDTTKFNNAAVSSRVVWVPYSASGYELNGVTPGNTTFLLRGPSQLTGTDDYEDLQALMLDRGYVGGIPIAQNLRNKRIEIVAGTLRQNASDRTKWDWIADANHVGVGVNTAVQATASGSQLTVNFNKTYSRVITFLCGPDETLANRLNFTCGASVGLSSANIKASINLTLAALIRYTGATWEIAYGTGQGGISSHNVEITSAVFSSGNLTLAHSWCDGADAQVSPWSNGGAVVPYIPVIRSIADGQTIVSFANYAGAFVTTADTNMAFGIRKNFSEGIVLDGTGGTEALDLDLGNIWMIGIFEV